MNFIYNFFPQKLIEAAGWTIFHSLWQGAIISVLLGVVLLIAGKKSAKLRYNFSLAALIVAFLLSAATFIQVYNSTDKDTSSVNQTISSALFTDPVTQNYLSQKNINSDKDIVEALENYFAQHLNLIVTLWLAGFIIFSVRFVGGVIYVQKLRSSGINLVENEYWFYRLKELADSLELKQIIKIYESAKVKTPITLGYLKPIILLPIGMLCGLPQEQIEAIILHELAHIKRYDFLFNLIQTVIETIFFYHPAVWWISSVIKNERENCCDDLTLKLCSGSLVYFKALYNLQQICSEEKDIVLAALGKRNQLFRRINRMNSNNKNTSYGAKFATFAVMLVLFAAASIYSTSSGRENTLNVVTASFVNPFNVLNENTDLKSLPGNVTPTPDTSSIKKGKKTLKFDDDDKRYKAKLNNGKLEELYIDGDKVDQKDLQKYEGKVAERVGEYDSAMNEFRGNMKEFKEKMKTLKEKMNKFGKGNGYYYGFNHDTDFPPNIDSADWKEMMENIQHGIKESFANHSFHIPPVPPINIPPVHIPPINIPPIHIPKIDWNNDEDCDSFDNEEFKESMKEWKDNFKKEMEHFKFDMKDFNANMDKFKKEMKKNGPGSESFKKSMKKLKENMSKLKEELRPLKEFINEMKEELVKDNLVKDEDDIDNLTLSQNEMIVNDKKVPEDLHKKYLELYKKHFGKELKGDKKFVINN
jgi:bla regulator protein blaR1